MSNSRLTIINYALLYQCIHVLSVHANKHFVKRSMIKQSWSQPYYGPKPNHFKRVKTTEWKKLLAFRDQALHTWNVEGQSKQASKQASSRL